MAVSTRRNDARMALVAVLQVVILTASMVFFPALAMAESAPTPAQEDVALRLNPKKIKLFTGGTAIMSAWI